MAWNPSPGVAVARDAARKLKADYVVVIFIRSGKGQIGSASYGETKAKCSHIKGLADVLYAKARDWVSCFGLSGDGE